MIDDKGLVWVWARSSFVLATGKPKDGGEVSPKWAYMRGSGMYVAMRKAPGDERDESIGVVIDGAGG